MRDFMLSFFFLFYCFKVSCFFHKNIITSTLDLNQILNSFLLSFQVPSFPCSASSTL